MAAITTTIDPVCGMTVDPATAAGHSEWNGETYHFCCKSCKAKFDADPARFVQSAEHYGHDEDHDHEHRHARRHDAAPATKDPVCGMTVDPSHAAGSHSHGGTTYFFCSRACLE